ncbi:MAG: peptidoglycan-associated lipoprotein Pal [Candidatus Eisenbacteria bacterium]|nr:peptidoglycan-associated lipoprotein Pal [Candidatus Eisenbacteria bacterium]
MKTVGSIVLALILTLALSLGFAACSKKPKPAVDVPEETQEEPEGRPSQEPIRAEREPGAPGEADVELQDVYFDFDRHNLRPDALRTMERNAEMLKENPDARVVLEGHCDERGTSEYNLALGEKRARTVESFLRRYGIDGSRLTVISYGEERPFDPGHNEAAWAKNRRVHFVLR